MTDLRTAAQQVLEALEEWHGAYPHRVEEDDIEVAEALRAALADPVLQTCNCRWDGEMQMQQCTLHEAHVDAIKEWAQRAKFAEKKLAALAEPVQEPVAWRWGYRSVTTGEIDWRGYVEIAADPNLRSPAIIMEPLYAAPLQRNPLTEEEIREMFFAELRALPSYPSAIEELPERLARAIERAHGITP